MRTACAAIAVISTAPLGAVSIPVPNASFESPATSTYVTFPNDAPGVTGAWESTGGGFRAVFRPEMYPGGPGCAPAGMNGLLAASLSDCGVFQELAPYDGSGNPDLYWQAGRTYTLKAGVGVRPDVTAPEAGRTLSLRFYFRTADQGTANTLANKTLTAGTAAVNNWALTDHTVTHTVSEGAPEVGKPIGLWLATGGGIGDWTVDHLRLTAVETSTLPATPLIAEWKMNQSAGQSVPALPDASFDGVFSSNLAGTPALSWSPGEGKGGALRLNAPTDRVEIPAPDFTKGFTVMGWIKPDAGTLTPWARFISNQYTNGFFLGRDGTNSRWRFIVNGSVGLGSMAGGELVTGEWQHLCGTYDGTTARLFVDGVQVATQNVVPPAAPAQPLYLGSENTTDRAIPGLIDEIKAFSAALSAAEIAELHAGEAGAFNGYDAWASSHGIDPAGPRGGPMDDFDADGTANGIERALGLLPADGGSRFAIAITGDVAVGVTLVWPSQPGLNFIVKSSTDLEAWPTTEAAVPAAANPATTTTWNTGPLPAGSTKFYRVEVTP